MSDKDLETKKLICELCRQFFEAGWVTGTGGSISIRNDDRIFMTPSGVQKERIQPDEVFTVNIKGEVVDTPAQKLGGRVPKLSDCAPLFLHAYQQRNAGTAATLTHYRHNSVITVSTVSDIQVLCFTAILRAATSSLACSRAKLSSRFHTKK